MNAIAKASAMLVAVLLAACVTAELARAADTVTAIVGVTIIHPERAADAAVAKNATVIIAGNRIQTVGPVETTRLPAGAVIIDGRGKWLVPGLVDSHVHFFQSGNLYTRPDVADFNRWKPYKEEVARNKARLPSTFKVWLASGVTSVIDVGGPFWNFEVRDAARISSAAPRVAVAGPLLSTIDDSPLDLGDPPIIKVTTNDEARALVQRELERRPDFIKFWFIYDKGDDINSREAIVRTAADTAHAAGVRFAVHATELVVAKAALRAGADYLVHSVEDEPVDAEFIALARSRHSLYCPTLFVGMGYDYALSGTWEATELERRLADPAILVSMHDLQKIPKALIPGYVTKLMNERKPVAMPRVAMQNLRKVWDAGIPVAMGTDAGNIGTVHGPSVFREMKLMNEAGLTPLEVLRSATVNGAIALGMEHDLGAVAPGKLADLVILDADPLADVVNLSRVSRVFKDGKSFVPADLLRSLQ
jgi:imidazolonepropionase-like amidohydrolase